MKIGLVGYGKMGRMVEAAAKARGHEIVSVTDPAQPASALPAPDSPEDAGVLIEFTAPEAALDNIRAAAALGVPIVAGTTGWHDRLAEAEAAVKAGNSAVLWASNFSFGVNLFYRIASYAASIIDPFAEYDVGGFEIHHNKKADSPSGTAKALVERVLAAMTRKTGALWDRPGAGPASNVIHYASIRAGAAPGTHSLLFDSAADTIEITHTARNREGFALGAVIAAEWLIREKRRGIFTMDDVFEDILEI